MAQLTIDDRQVEAEDGQTVLDAAKALGIEIPTLCYHRAIPPAGACRIFSRFACGSQEWRLVSMRVIG